MRLGVCFEFRDDKDDFKKGKDRTPVFDGILHVLRSLRRLSPAALVAHGEAGLAAFATSEKELRDAA